MMNFSKHMDKLSHEEHYKLYASQRIRKFLMIANTKIWVIHS